MARQTEGAVLFELGKPLRIIPLIIPSLKPGQVLVEMAYSGVCGSQLLEVNGKRGPDRFLPHTLGHEGSGRVLEIGEGVVKVRPGDPVVLSWIQGDGMEVPSAVYGSEEGPINSGAIATFVRKTMVSENRLTPLPENMPLREGALLGCAIPTGAGMVLHVARLNPGSSIAIFGLGGVGMSALLAARMRKASPLIAVDIMDHKLEAARKVGATHTLNPQSQDPLQAIRKITGGRGVDYALEAVGKRESMELAFEAVREKGGLCILAGNLRAGERISLNPYDLVKGKRIAGTWGGECRPDRDIPIFAKHYLSGTFPLDKMITHTYRLEGVNQALRDLEEGRVARALVDFHGSGD